MSIERQYRTFTANDSLAFLIFPNSKPICLGTLTTISWSLLREKQQVTTIGRVNVAGFTRGIRIVAGTMIFTMLNQHWVNDLIEQVPELQQYEKIKADEFPICDLMIVCANEYGASVTGYIYGIDLTDESGVISVQDLFIENTCKFLARDIDMFCEFDYNTGKFIDNNYAISQSLSYNDNDYFYNEVVYSDNHSHIEQNEVKRSTSTNNSVSTQSTLQNKLLAMGYEVDENMIYGDKTTKAIAEFQSNNGLESTGIIDSKTLEYLYKEKYDLINTRKYKVPVYKEPSTNSNIIRYLNSYETFKDYEVVGDFIQISNGYVLKNDLIIKEPFMYSTNTSDIIESSFDDLLNGDINYKFNNFITDVSFKVSAISYYTNNKQCFSTMIYCNKEDHDIEISLSELPQSYVYNPVYEELPNKIEFIITPIGYSPYKKIINIVKEEETV